MKVGFARHVHSFAPALLMRRRRVEQVVEQIEQTVRLVHERGCCPAAFRHKSVSFPDEARPRV
jgi:hypothetical protein